MQLSFGLANTESASDKVKVAAAELARPWVSPMIWALYKAYWAATMHAVSIAEMLKIGVDPRQFLAPEKIAEFLEAALPENKEMFNPLRPAILMQLLNLLELRLLVEVRRDISSVVPDMANVDRAQRIVTAASNLGTTGTSAPTGH